MSTSLLRTNVVQTTDEADAVENADIHVVQKGEKWIVLQEGLTESGASFNDESEAVEIAAKVAAAEGLGLFVHVGTHVIEVSPQSYLDNKRGS